MGKLEISNQEFSNDSGIYKRFLSALPMTELQKEIPPFSRNDLRVRKKRRSRPPFLQLKVRVFLT